MSMNFADKQAVLQRKVWAYLNFLVQSIGKLMIEQIINGGIQLKEQYKYDDGCA